MQLLAFGEEQQVGFGLPLAGPALCKRGLTRVHGSSRRPLHQRCSCGIYLYA